jgi:hypothetical protein
MFSAISEWIERYRSSRRLVRDDAQRLIGIDPASAYYDAQRAAARARVAGDPKSFMHWARVAAEVARISNAPMDIEVVRRIVADEEQRVHR